MRNPRWIIAAAGLLSAACGGSGSDVTGPPAGTAPTANFGVTCTGLTCSFSDSSSAAQGGGAITAWQWNFGDSATATDQNPTHSYAAAGSYNATLTVTDSAGTTGSVTKPVTVQAPAADLTCTNATSPGGASTCSFTLPEQASVTVVSTDNIPCEAHGDVFAFTAPVADTLSTDVCFAPVGTQVTLPSAPAGTQVSFNFVSGLTGDMTALQVTGQYPQWTIVGEDAIGAPFPPDFADLGVTLTVTPGP